MIKIQVTSVDYCGSEDDIDFSSDNPDELDLEILKIKNSLPQEMIFEIECEIDELEDEVINYVSKQTGWLVNSIKYTIIS